MFSDSVFSSVYSEVRWQQKINETLEKYAEINIGSPSPCIFRVPKSLLCISKPHVYTPQKIGIGPYHYFRPDLYAMERRKLSAANRILNKNQLSEFKAQVVDELKKLEPNVRACYDGFLDLDGYTLAWITAIDSLYLLDFLRNNDGAVGSSGEGESNLNDGILGSADFDSDADGKLTQDMFMLENQIPIPMFERVRKYSSVNFEAGKVFRRFCEAHSPLKLTQKPRLVGCRAHLLDYMYDLIVDNTRSDVVVATRFHMATRVLMIRSVVDQVQEALDAAVYLGAGGVVKDVLNIFTFLKKAPLDKFPDLVRGEKAADEQKKPVVEKIDIPCATYLSKYGGQKFEPAKEGIWSVDYDKEKKTFYLPVITMNSYSEVILKNLLAYEASVMPKSKLKLAEYIDLMCGIVDSIEDVKLLKEKEIIAGNLPEQEIVDFFNGINRTTDPVSNNNDRSIVLKTIGEANEQYAKNPLVKAYRVASKAVYGCWRVLAVVFSLLVLILLTLQAFCQVYDCKSHHWFKHSSSSTLYTDM